METCKICTEMPAPDLNRSIRAAVEECSGNLCDTQSSKLHNSPEVRAAIRNLENAIVAPYIAVTIAKKWNPGSTLTIGFVGDVDAVVKERIIEKAELWVPHIGLKLDFTSSGRAKIRIATWQGQGSWSYVGTDALLIDGEDQPTMNFGWLEPDTDDDEYERVVLHEFGHALGAIHEHQHPSAGIPWDKERVYSYYADTNGWDRDKVDYNIFRKYERDQLNASEYDPDSIMHYAVPDALTVGDWQVGWNRHLSERDKAFMAELYG